MTALPPEQSQPVLQQVDEVGGKVIYLGKPPLARKGTVLVSRTLFRESRKPLIGLVLGISGLARSPDVLSHYHVLFVGPQYFYMTEYSLQHDCLIVPKCRVESVSDYRFESALRLHHECSFGRFDNALLEAQRLVGEHCRFF